LRRIMVYLLLITGILTIILGIAEAVTHQNRPYIAHIVVASIFILTCVVHIVLNRKSVIRCLRGGK
jgi:hypothetical protein